MASISFDAAGNVVSEDFTGSITDPSKEVRYTDEQLAQAAASVPAHIVKNSPEQAELNRMNAHIDFLRTKANEVTGYNAAGEPQYVVGNEQRDRLLKQADSERENQKLQLLLSERTMGERYLDEQTTANKPAEDAANYAALEERAKAIAFETQAQELAQVFMRANKMHIK